MKIKSQSNKIIPIILAAGRGSRMGNLTKNKKIICTNKQREETY